MINRRSLLISLGTIATGQLLSSCSQPNSNLKVMVLESSIPPQLLGEFRKEIAKGEKLIFKPQAQLEDIYSLLENWQKPQQDNKPAPPADLVTLGNYWLTKAREENLIEPLNLENLPLLSPQWQNLVKYQGSIWGAPYRWGTTMIAYRSDRLDFTPTDWQDLWRQDLQERISLLDQPREVIGLTLKKQGYSYNTEDLSTINNLKTELLKLQKQVKFYASTNYLQPLILGDTWVAVGWSTDILPLVERYPNIQAVIPQSGTAIWADLWVKPKSATANNTNLAQKWIDFCWQPQSVNKISLFTDAVSPLILSMKPEELLVNIRNNPLRLVNQEIMNNSEFIQILPEVSQQQYISLWTEIRSQAI